MKENNDIKNSLLSDVEKKITQEDLDKEKEEQRIKKDVEYFGYKNEDPMLKANFISKFFFFWVFRIIRVNNKKNIFNYKLMTKNNFFS
jgi:hypothetical protein